MSPKKSNIYEIYTSMKTELILEELKGMKRKFFPLGAVSAEHFGLMVLAPPHQSGRRRSGGFVELSGKISEQGDVNCIEIKTGSGAGFILPVGMGFVFMLAIVMAFIAGNGRAQLLFPIAVLLIIYAALFCLRKSDSKKAEEILREHFEGTDRVTEFRYTTHYTLQQCMEFMGHENQNDIYRYEWKQESSFGALVIKDYKHPDRVRDFDGRQEWGFVVRFHEQPDSAETLIAADLVQTEKLPYIHNKEKIDMFWKEKLGASVKTVSL